MGRAYYFYNTSPKGTVCLFLFYILFFASGLSSSLFSQEGALSNNTFTPTEIWESGLPSIENYSSSDYQSSPQNWGFTEGSNGSLYAANTNGVLQYDGATWSTISLPNKSLVRSIAASDNEKVYVGGVNELGYLAPDAVGKMKYHSLKSFLKEEQSEFRDVWSIQVMGDLVYFENGTHILRWDGATFKVFAPEVAFGSLYKVNNEIYVESKGVGILKVNGDTLQLVPNGALVNNERAKTEGILPYKDHSLLLINTRHGMSVFDGDSIYQLHPESNTLFQKNRIYKSIRLSNGDYAMATTTTGLYIVDGETGAIKKRIGKREGLISDVLFSVYEDRFGAIWVGSDNGISKIDWASPFRSFNEFNGLNERVRSALYHKGRLYVDSKGLHELVKNNAQLDLNVPSFKKI